MARARGTRPTRSRVRPTFRPTPFSLRLDNGAPQTCSGGIGLELVQREGPDQRADRRSVAAFTLGVSWRRRPQAAGAAPRPRSPGRPVAPATAPRYPPRGSIRQHVRRLVATVARIVNGAPLLFTISAAWVDIPPTRSRFDPPDGWPGRALLPSAGPARAGVGHPGDKQDPPITAAVPTAADAAIRATPAPGWSRSPPSTHVTPSSELHACSGTDVLRRVVPDRHDPAGLHGRHAERDRGLAHRVGLPGDAVIGHPGGWRAGPAHRDQALPERRDVVERAHGAAGIGRRSRSRPGRPSTRLPPRGSRHRRRPSRRPPIGHRSRPAPAPRCCACAAGSTPHPGDPVRARRR